MTELVPVDRLTAHGQLFRCEPLHATMPVRACLARQGAKTDARIGPKKPAFPACAACPIGAAIAARVEGVPDTGAPLGRICTEPGCGAVVANVPARLPARCPVHRNTTPTTQETTMPKTETETEIPCDRCGKHPRSAVTGKTPPGTENACLHCRRVAAMRAGKGAEKTTSAAPRPLGRPRKTPPPEAPTTLRLIVPPESANAAAPLRSSSPIRVTVVTIECDASLAGSLSAIVGSLR